MEHPPCSVVPACNLAVLSRLPTGNPTKECAMIGGPPALGDKLQRIINVDCSNLRLTQEAKQKIIPRPTEAAVGWRAIYERVENSFQGRGASSHQWCRPRRLVRPTAVFAAPDL